MIVATRQTASVKGKQTRDECQAQTEPTALLPSRHTTSGAATLPRYSSTRGHVLIVSWASGGNLPPLVTAGRLVAARDQAVSVLASAATRAAAVRAGFEVIGYRRAPAPNTELAFEERAAELMATTAGTEVALDVRDVVAQVQPDLMIVDCMLPAGIAVGEAMGTPTASLVHFPYGLARAQMLRGAGAWTTDLTQLNITRRSLGLKPAANGPPPGNHQNSFW